MQVPGPEKCLKYSYTPYHTKPLRAPNPFEHPTPSSTQPLRVPLRHLRGECGADRIPGKPDDDARPVPWVPRAHTKEVGTSVESEGPGSPLPPKDPFPKKERTSLGPMYQREDRDRRRTDLPPSFMCRPNDGPPRPPTSRGPSRLSTLLGLRAPQLLGGSGRDCTGQDPVGLPPNHVEENRTWLKSTLKTTKGCVAEVVPTTVVDRRRAQDCSVDNPQKDPESEETCGGGPKGNENNYRDGQGRVLGERVPKDRQRLRWDTSDPPEASPSGVVPRV